MSLNMVFMDQRGTTFHDDLSQLEELSLMFPNCRAWAAFTERPDRPGRNRDAERNLAPLRSRNRVEVGRCWRLLGRRPTLVLVVLGRCFLCSQKRLDLAVLIGM